ncbi:MAG: Crp/Fnr family transcriptional regulator [Saprospiraceae bacterium]|nr:Crp/Fnr family transcriptional regulator [Saprospiraceae bacterium]MCB0676080.1 Crp/Fnr family transcriptional regulator [Saprospiraceae bacterium]MCB0683557.1 Crp/Fnr family transcriptional regulator [Saprospiraceae bacterium]
MKTALDQLRALIGQIHPLPEVDREALASIWSPFSAKRKEVLTLAGEREKYLYFVAEGVQRVYYFDEFGREATIVFTYAPSFGGVLDSLLLQEPSRYYFETLTRSEFLRASALELLQLMNERPAVERMVRLGLTRTFSGVVERLVELQCYSSEEKFRSLLSRSPHILQLVPHKYLANYLGIDPTNFSKFINQLKL